MPSKKRFFGGLVGANPLRSGSFQDPGSVARVSSNEGVVSIDSAGPEKATSSTTTVTLPDYTTYSETQFTASNAEAGDELGHSCDMSGDGTIVVIGAPFEDGPTNSTAFSGAVYVYENGTEVAILRASDAAANDSLGFDVAISNDGSTIAVGSPQRSSGGTYLSDGAVYVYEKPTNGWTTTSSEDARLTHTAASNSESLGRSVAISDNGDTIVVGRSGAQNGTTPNVVHVYEKPTNGWANTSSSAVLSASNGQYADDFGSGLAISGDGSVIAIGAPEEDTTQSNSGTVYVYEKPTNGWATSTEDHFLGASTRTSVGEFGISCSLNEDGTVLVVGEWAYSSTGRVHVLEYSGSSWSHSAILTGSSGYTGRKVDVSRDGTTVAAVNPAHNSNEGAVYIWIKPSSGWANSSYHRLITAANGAANDYLGGEIGGSFAWMHGLTLTNDGGKVLASAPQDDDGGAASGSGFLFAATTTVPSSTTTTTTTQTPQWFWGGLRGRDAIVEGSGVGDDKSLRFDGSGDYLINTFGSPTKNNVWTFSGWFKRASTGSRQFLFNTVTSNGEQQLYSEFFSDNTILIQDYTSGGSSNWKLQTNATFTDTSSWYHIVFVFDSPNSSAKIYVNGTEATYSTNSQPSLNVSSFANSNGVEHIIGAFKTTSGSPSSLFNGQMAEVHFIDGTAYDASYFGETRDGVWVPKEVTGVTYGNNGFYLDFSQPSSTTNAFNAVTFVGDGANSRAVSGVGFQADMIWLKNRDTAYSPQIVDTVRGATKALLTNSSSDEGDTQTSFSGGGVETITADGFTIGDGITSNNNLNASGDKIVGWTWKAGGAPTAINSGGQTPTSGSVMIDGVASTAQLPTADIYPTKMSVNTEAGFSIVGYEGNETSGATVPHGLNQTPELIIIKTRDLAARNWYVGSSYLPSYNNFLYLNTTASSLSSTSTFNDTAPTSSVFTLGNSDGTNASSSMIAYCWHSVPGYSKIGSYVGNGSSNGPIIKTGFRPAFLMIKNTTTGSIDDWHIFDNARDFANPNTYRLKANLSATESSTDAGVDFLADGFQLINNSGARNASNNTYIYMAFADTSPNLGVDRSTDGTGVTLLLDGTSTTDKSSASTGLTNNGVAVNQNSQSHPYASGALLFDGSDDLTITTENDNLYLGADDWTIEGWFRTTNLSATRTILEYRTSGGDNGAGKMFIGVLSTGQVGIYENTAYQAQSATGSIVTNTWYHLAFVRSGGTVYVFVDGSLADSGSLSSSTVDILRPTSRPIIGGFNGGPYNWIGEWVDFRVTKGVARYTGSFTRPTSALTNDDTWDKPKNNFSVEGNITPDDQLLDAPNLRFASFDPSNKGANVTLSEANFNSVSSSGYSSVITTETIPTNSKIYVEWTCDNSGALNFIGIAPSLPTGYVGDASTGWGLYMPLASGNLEIWNNGQLATTLSTSGPAAPHVAMMAVDRVNNEIHFGYNGIWHTTTATTTTTPTLPSSAPVTGIDSNSTYYIVASPSPSRSVITNLGQDHTFAGQKSAFLTPYSDANGVGEFYYQPPSGFLALADNYAVTDALATTGVLSTSEMLQASL